MNDYFDLAGRTILVTGASSGLGRHFAMLLARRGARIAAGARRVELLRSLADELSGEGHSLLPVSLDVGSLESIRFALDIIERELGPVDALINNAGIAVQGKAVDLNEADYDRMFDTNTRGAFFAAQECAVRMIKRGSGGSIINIASAAGLVQMPQLTAYGMTKAAVIHMTKSLAREWARFGINVNAICPGYIATDINRAFFESEAGKKAIAGWARCRIGEASDLEAPLLLLLDRDRSKLMTGSIISVDDGYSLG